MARLLVPNNKEWYDELNSVGYYDETEYEMFIKQHVNSLFPDFYCFSFKKSITGPNGDNKKPDMALLKNDYSEWWIIETELESHSIVHVIEQTSAFRYGDYNSYEISEYIFSQIDKEHGTKVNRKKTDRLISKSSPNILVIVDAQKADWRQELQKIDVKICLFEIYKSNKHAYIYRIDGEYPISVEKESQCRWDRKYPTLLYVKNIALFKEKVDTDVEINYIGRLTKWLVIEIKGKIFLKFIGKENPFAPNAQYVIFRDSADNFHIRIN